MCSSDLRARRLLAMSSVQPHRSAGTSPWQRIAPLAQGVEAAEIDRVNILQASLRAMALAVSNLAPRPDYLLIVGNFPIPVDLPQEPIVKGDARSASIAAASIICRSC